MFEDEKGIQREIKDLKVGDVCERRGVDPKTSEPKTVRYVVLEIGWFDSPSDPGSFILGIKARPVDEPDGEVEVISALSLKGDIPVEVVS